MIRVASDLGRSPETNPPDRNRKCRYTYIHSCTALMLSSSFLPPYFPQEPAAPTTQTGEMQMTVPDTNADDHPGQLDEDSPPRDAQSGSN